MLHDPKSVQVIVSVIDRREKLLLRDTGEVFLFIPPVTDADSRSTTPSVGTLSDVGIDDLSGEPDQLCNLLQGLEEQKAARNEELESSWADVALLKAELSKAQEKTLELWQENCEHLTAV